MGAGNVKAVYARWASLDDLPFRVLTYMAVVSHDVAAPRYYGGREALALAAGRPVPDRVPGNTTVTAARRAAFKAIDRVIDTLTAAGALVQTLAAFPGRRAEYALNLAGQAVLFDGRTLADALDMSGRCGHPKASGGPCAAWPKKGSDRCVAHQEPPEWTPVSGPNGPRSVDLMHPGEWTNAPRSVDIMHPAHRGPKEEEEQRGIQERNTGEDEAVDLDAPVTVARATNTAPNPISSSPPKCPHGFKRRRRPDGTPTCTLCRREAPCPNPDPDTFPAAPPRSSGPTGAPPADPNASAPNPPRQHGPASSPRTAPPSPPAASASPPSSPASPTPAAGSPRKDAA